MLKINTSLNQAGNQGDISQKTLEELWGSGFNKLTLKQRQLISEILSNSTKMSFNSKTIKLPIQEVQAKTGCYRNPATGAVWQLYIKDEKLTIDVPNFSFQIFPLSPTKFKPVDSLVNLEFEFEQSRQNRPSLMHIYAKGINRATFEAQ